MRRLLAALSLLLPQLAWAQGAYTEVRYVFFATPAAVAHANANYGSIQNYVTAIVAKANQVAANSGVLLNNVQVGAVNTTAVGNELGSILNFSQMVDQQVEAYRDAQGAAVSVLIGGWQWDLDNSMGGVAEDCLVARHNPMQAKIGVNILNDQQNFTFAHEVGHMACAGHNDGEGGHPPTTSRAYWGKIPEGPNQACELWATVDSDYFPENNLFPKHTWRVNHPAMSGVFGIGDTLQQAGHGMAAACASASGGYYQFTCVAGGCSETNPTSGVCPITMQQKDYNPIWAPNVPNIINSNFTAYGGRTTVQVPCPNPVVTAPYYSNPSIAYKGLYPTGTPTRNNSATIAASMGALANLKNKKTLPIARAIIFKAIERK